MLNFNQIIELTEKPFFQLCQNHPVYRFECIAKGELIILPPTGGETGKKKLLTCCINLE